MDHPHLQNSEPLVIAFGCDHAGYSLQQHLMKKVEKHKYVVVDCGTTDQQAVDYPEFAERVVKKVLEGQADRGVLICGSGIGMSITANRHRGIRAACCYDASQAFTARQHNDINILCLGSRVTSEKVALECLMAFLETTFEGGRHQQRLNQIDRH
jgi:ribose 5-phosphate isomerase B